MGRIILRKWGLAMLAIVGAACMPGAEGGAASPSASISDPGPLTQAGGIPADVALSVGAVPAAEVLVFVGNTGPRPDATRVCDAMFLDIETVSILTEMPVSMLRASVLADNTGVRCEYHFPADEDGFDGNFDGEVEVVSAYVGLVSEGATDTLAEVPARAVVTTPNGLDVRQVAIDPEFLDDVDPATSVDLYELDVGTRVAVAVSTAVDRGPDAALTMLDLVLSGVVASTTE